MKGLTQQEAVKAVTWFQECLLLTDWEIVVGVTAQAPPWVGEDDRGKLGCCQPHVQFKSADIWINASPPEKGYDALATLFHECMHVVAADVGVQGDTSPHVEFVWNRLGLMFALLYRGLPAKERIVEREPKE